MTEKVDCLVIGAGVVGLAIGRALTQQGREVVIAEAESEMGTHTSARNTGVIHAGIGYPLDSLKGRLCRVGRELLYRYCADHGVGHKRIGKLLCAPVGSGDDGKAAVLSLKAKAERNGVGDLQLLDAAGVRELEPVLSGPAALFSPSSGIIDPHDLMHEYLGDVESNGGWLLRNSPVTGGRVTDGCFEVHIGGSSPVDVRCRILVNSAGLGAPAVANSIQGLPAPPQYYLMKGTYFVLRGRSPFSHLIYPVSQGLHASLDIAGQLRFGPDFEWVDKVNYDVDETRAPKFYESIRKFWPDLPDGALSPGWAGVRPKIGVARANDIDFRIDGPETHGIPGLVSLFGIESPGLTASLAIGQEVAERLNLRRQTKMQ